MVEIIWTEPALSDLNNIAEYIALDKPNVARLLVNKVFSAVERLILFPESGRYPPELINNKRYRELIIGPCRVFYRHEKKQVYIVYIMRSESELKKYILNRE